jgi:hypothetical protein
MVLLINSKEIKMKELDKFLGIVLLAIIVVVIATTPVMLLWNFALVPAVTGLVKITWFQASGIYILFNMLFKQVTIPVNK